MRCLLIEDANDSRMQFVHLYLFGARRWRAAAFKTDTHTNELSSRLSTVYVKCVGEEEGGCVMKLLSAT